MPMMNENKLTQLRKTSLNKIPLYFLLIQKQPSKDFSLFEVIFLQRIPSWLIAFTQACLA